jgi:hypothetical protein
MSDLYLTQMGQLQQLKEVRGLKEIYATRAPLFRHDNVRAAVEVQEGGQVFGLLYRACFKTFRSWKLAGLGAELLYLLL